MKWSLSLFRMGNLSFVQPVWISCPFVRKEYPTGSIAKISAPVSKLQGFDVVKYTTQNLFPGLVEAGLKHLEEKIVETRVEALVIDTVYFYLEFVPLHLGMPYVHIWNMFPIDFSGTTPPSFFRLAA